MSRTPFKMKGYSYPGTSPVKKGEATTPYSQEAQNLLRAVPNEEAFNKLSEVDQKGFVKAAKKAGLPMTTVKKKSPIEQSDKPWLDSTKEDPVLYGKTYPEIKVQGTKKKWGMKTGKRTSPQELKEPGGVRTGAQRASNILTVDQLNRMSQQTAETATQIAIQTATHQKPKAKAGKFNPANLARHRLIDTDIKFNPKKQGYKFD
jgi:hypothetical protein